MFVGILNLPRTEMLHHMQWAHRQELPISHVSTFRVNSPISPHSCTWMWATFELICTVRKQQIIFALAFCYCVWHAMHRNHSGLLLCRCRRGCTAQYTDRSLCALKGVCHLTKRHSFTIEHRVSVSLCAPHFSMFIHRPSISSPGHRHPHTHTYTTGCCVLCVFVAFRAGYIYLNTNLSIDVGPK